MDVDIINKSEGFYTIREEWNEHLGRSKSNNIFLRWEWLYYWWLTYGGSNKLLIIIVRERKRLIGIAPLYVKIGNLSLTKEIRFLGSNIVCSDYLDFILLKNYEEKALQLILSYLKENDHIWDILNLTDIPSESKNLPVIESFFKNNRIDANTHYRTCPYIELTGDWDTVYSSFSSSLRNIIRRKGKKLEKMNGSIYYEVDKNDDLEFYFNEFLRINTLRLEKRGIKSPFLEEKFRTFHYRIIEYLYKNDMVKLCFIKVDGKIVAGLYILYYKNKCYYYQSGLDPSWKKFSVGTLLFHYCINQAHAMGMDEFDFLQGNEDYKNNWTKNKRNNARIRIYNNSQKGRVLFYFDKKNVLKNAFFNYFKKTGEKYL